MRCANSKHVWKAKGAREVCTICKTSFPCERVACGHLDCHEARGEPPPPPGIVVHDKAARVIPFVHIRAPGVVDFKRGAIAYTDGIDPGDRWASEATVTTRSATDATGPWVVIAVAPEIQVDRERSTTPEVQAAPSLVEILGLAKPAPDGTPDA